MTAEQMAATDIRQYMQQVAWFKHLGAASAHDAEVVRVHLWDDCPNGYSPEVEARGELFMRWHDQVMDAAAGVGRHAQAADLFAEIKDMVEARAEDEVPYDASEDPNHAPTRCGWDCAWIAALIGCAFLIGWPLPPELAAHWRWVQRGHWPCGYAHPPSDAAPGRLIVY